MCGRCSGYMHWRFSTPFHEEAIADSERLRGCGVITVWFWRAGTGWVLLPRGVSLRPLCGLAEPSVLLLDRRGSSSSCSAALLFCWLLFCAAALLILKAGVGMAHDLLFDTTAASAPMRRHPFSALWLNLTAECNHPRKRAQRGLDLNPRREVSECEARGAEVRRVTRNPESQIFEATSASARGYPPLIRDH